MQNDFAGQNAFDLAGGINLTMFQGKNGSAGIQILSTGVSLNNGGGYNGFAITGGYNSQTGTEQVGWNGTSTLNDFGNEAASIGSGIASGISAAAGAIGNAANFVYNGVSGAVSALASTIPPAGNNAASAAFEGTPADQTEEMKKLNAASNYGIDVKDMLNNHPNTSTVTIDPSSPAYSYIASQAPIPPTGKTYPVSNGDTLANIAASNNMSLSQLLALNPQLKGSENYIVPGQTIALDSTASAQFAGQTASQQQMQMSSQIGAAYTASQTKQGQNGQALLNGLLPSVNIYGNKIVLAGDNINTTYGSSAVGTYSAIQTTMLLMQTTYDNASTVGGWYVPQSPSESDNYHPDMLAAWDGSTQTTLGDIYNAWGQANASDNPILSPTLKDWSTITGYGSMAFGVAGIIFPPAEGVAGALLWASASLGIAAGGEDVGKGIQDNWNTSEMGLGLTEILGSGISAIGSYFAGQYVEGFTQSVSKTLFRTTPVWTGIYGRTANEVTSDLTSTGVDYGTDKFKKIFQTNQ